VLEIDTCARVATVQIDVSASVPLRVQTVGSSGCPFYVCFTALGPDQVPPEKVIRTPARAGQDVHETVLMLSGR
jgi:hypothetical protein